MLIILLFLSVVVSLIEALEEISSVVAPVMRSETGILVTATLTAFLTYRWYRARHSA